MTTVNDSVNKSQIQQDKILDNIKKLQGMENELYGELQSKSAAGADDSEQDIIINKINTLSDIRTSMFDNLTAMYGNIQSQLASNREDVVDKLTVVGIVEKEMDNAKKNINSLKTERNNKLRMVEINTYYEKQYNAYTEVMMIILYTLIPILVLAILRRRKIIPTRIINIIIVIIAAVGGGFLFLKVYDLSRRNNMDYEKYDWPSMSSDGTLDDYVPPPNPMGDDLSLDSSLDTVFGCIGKNCCAEGTYYDKDMNKCLIQE